MPTARQATLIVWFAGMLVLVGLTVWYGADHVGAAIISAGWAALLVVAVRVAAVAIAGAGWWLLFPADVRPSVWTCVGLRFVREGANALLPLAQIGGDFIGARCLALRGVRGTLAAASVIVDVLMQAASQMVFALIGLVLLIAIGGNELIVWPVALGIALALPALGGFVLIQGERGQRLIKWVLNAVAGDRQWLTFGAIDDLFTRLDTLYSNRGNLIKSVVWHLGGWFVGALEVWLVLTFMGYSIDFGDAVLIESLMHAPAEEHKSNGWRKNAASWDLALEAFEAKNQEKAFQILYEDLERQHSGRGRFRCKQQLVDLCIKAGKEAVAQLLLDDLNAALDKHNLDDWEDQEFVTEALLKLMNSSKKMQSEENKKKLLERVCRLNPARAVKC